METPLIIMINAGSTEKGEEASPLEKAMKEEKEDMFRGDLMKMLSLLLSKMPSSSHAGGA